MPFCPFCGTPVKEQHKFCPSCGNPLEPVASRQGVAPQPAQAPQAQQYTPPTATSTPPTYAQIPPIAPQPVYQPMPQEPIRVIIPNLGITKSLGRIDIYNLIVTDRRSIFAKLTNEIMQEAIKQRRDKAEAEGKGFFGKWKAQMQGFNMYTDAYTEMTPDQILAETQGNWAIDNSSIRGMKFSADIDDEGGQSYYYTEITTITDKLKFRSDYNPKDLFSRAYGSI